MARWCVLTVLFGSLAVLAGYYFTTEVSEPDVERFRFGSFAPEREGDDVQVKWFVDGQDYMSAVADAIDSAQKEIFIAGWQVNPHIFLKRPETGISSLEWRLDQLLLRRAEEGVLIYVLLYWETKLAMDLGSDYTLKVLDHSNIEIHRHPTMSTPLENPSTFLRWSHHEKLVVVDRSLAFVGGIDLGFGRWDTHAHELTDDGDPHPCLLGQQGTNECMETKGSGSKSSEGKRYQRWIGKDYGNTFISGVRKDFDKPLEDYVDDRKEVPRMPWHDVSCAVSGPPALDVAKHFIQRYNKITSKSRLGGVSWGSGLWQLSWLQHHSKIHHSIPGPSVVKAKVQVLRSVGNWSAGQPKENSIHEAYLHAIEKAEHFIYIENQFFISSQDEEVQNKVQLALCDRIACAYQNDEDFHVIIILPLLPEMAGGWGTMGGKHRISYWNYHTLYHGKSSLFFRLKERKIPPLTLHRYISIYGLRTHDVLNEKLVTEIVYVHSKLMIVDDRLTIIGSANINDRSMAGDRDSEVDVIIEDTDMVDGQMNRQPYRVGKFSHGLRCHLLKEHLGMLDKSGFHVGLSIEDPVSYEFYSGLSKIASSNTKSFQQVFRPKIIPTNSVLNFKQLEEWKTYEGLADVWPDEAVKELNKIRGRIVDFPSLFLMEDLKPSAIDYVQMYVGNQGPFRELHLDDSGTLLA